MRLQVKSANREELAYLSFYNCCWGHCFRKAELCLWIFLNNLQCGFHLFNPSHSLPSELEEFLKGSYKMRVRFPDGKMKKKGVWL